jgi:predicted dehydrogenase
VTHIWTDDPADAPKVAKASLIEHVVAKPEDVIGHVDAAIISTDDGDDHVRRARPFIEAGLPVFVDKPMATNVADLNQFLRWHLDGKTILSTSGMRYAPEIRQITDRREQLGELRWLTSFTSKTWERYGIHALEAVAPVLGPGFLRAQTNHQGGSNIVTLTHRSGVAVTLAAVHDAYGSFGAVHAYGTKGDIVLKLTDTYTAFRAQLVAFIELLRTGRAPLPFSQTIELMAVIIAGLRSREQAGRVVTVREIYDELDGNILQMLEQERPPTQ